MDVRSATGTGGRKRDAASTRTALLQAGRRLFASTGYGATTVREIADAAGVNVALISRYFDSKEGLFEACLADAVDELRREHAGPAGLAGVPQAMASHVMSTPAGGHRDAVLLLLRSSGDEGAEQVRLAMLRTLAERLAAVAGWRAEAPDDDLLLRAQVVLCTSIGMAVLRATGGVEPLASATADDLTVPLQALVEALLGR